MTVLVYWTLVLYFAAEEASSKQAKEKLKRLKKKCLKKEDFKEVLKPLGTLQ